jgi:hypothetical protein
VLAGGTWFQHGAPWFGANGAMRRFGWELLYLYPLAWASALIISCRPVFYRAAPALRAAAQ